MSLREQGDPTGRFSDRVADYERYRPTYPSEAIDALLEGLDLPVAAADVGAGTGISARLLAGRGVTVHAIEPNEPMRLAGMAHHGGAGVSPARSPSDKPTAMSPVDREFNIHRRNLPHWQIGGSTYFVTFRTHRGTLSDQERGLVLDACLHWHQALARVDLVTVMPDHVHLLISPLEQADGTWHALPDIMQRIKGYTSHAIGKLRGKPGQVWQDEYFDRIIRDHDEYIEKWNDTLENPVAAGLASKVWEYPFTRSPPDVLAAGNRAVACGRDARTTEGTGQITWHATTGEATGLPEESVDLIVCAQAYHWLDPENAATEFLRILKPGGRIALMWNDWNEASPVAAGYAELIRTHTECLPEHHDSTEPSLSGRLQLKGTNRFEHAQRLDLDGLLGRALSASYVPKEGPAHDAIMQGLRDLHARHADDQGVVDLGLECLVFFVGP